MNRAVVAIAVLAGLCLPGYADTIILGDGTTYSGDLTAAQVKFTDLHGIQYTFPRADVQALVFNSSNDTVTLRNGKSYVGHYAGTSPLAFNGQEGVAYKFPISDVESIVFSRTATPAPVPSATTKVIPAGATLSVRTDEPIDSTQTRPGQTYRATIVERVYDVAGNEAIPAGTSARLLIRNVSGGGKVSSADLVLDLYSVDVHGHEYRVDTSDVKESSNKGIGKNRRTAEFLGGGAAIGALMGGIFGGGSGAGIGAASGAGAGALTQIFARGHKVQVPAESTLSFRLERRLVLHGPA